MCNSFHEDRPPALVRLQDEHWKPLIEKTKQEYGVNIKVIEGLFGTGQPPSTKRILEAVIEDFDEWELAGTIMACLVRVFRLTFG